MIKKCFWFLGLFCLINFIPLANFSLGFQNYNLVLHSPCLKPEEKFSEQVSAIPEFLQKGKIFNYEFTQKYFENLQKQVSIIEIPIWAYGTWKSDKQIQDFALVYGETSNSKPVEVNIDIYDVIGDLESEDGKIYSLITPGNIQKVLRAQNLMEYQIMLKDERHLGIGNFISRDFSLRAQVEMNSGKIIRVLQVESEKSYKLNAENYLFTEGWLKSFDENGKAYMLSHGFSVKQLIEKHKLINFHENLAQATSNSK
jgi:hypothetical protein